MKTIIAFGFASVVMFVASAEGLAFTQSEANEVARRLIIRAKSLRDCHDIPDEGELYKPEEDLGTWYGFLGLDETNGWTVAAKKATFDWYLSTLGTNNCQSLSSLDKSLVLTAVGLCESLAYTNAVPSLKALTVNPLGIYRETALEIVLNFSPVDDFTTQFVEEIVTNGVKFSMIERGCACGIYAQNIITRQATNDMQRAAKERAWKMLYRHRRPDLIGTGILDSLFISQVQGYDLSSNRLEFAEYVLSHPDADSSDIRRFTSVTNQLLSSGQPLPWINMGDGGN